MDKDPDRMRITRSVLRIHHDTVVQDIQGDVIMHLYRSQILTENEYLAIKSERDPRTEASCLLEFLPLKDSRGLSVFLNYLSTHYLWLAEPLQWSITREYNEVCSTKVQQILTSGEVPQLSLKHVSRSEHVKTLKEHIKKLEAVRVVVVYGMNGCGKSSLVVEALNDPLITMIYLEGIVQWIHVGRENSDVGYIQTEILNRLNDQEQLISTPLNTDYEATRRTLQQLWKQKNLSHGLLVLDDVCSEQIVKYLDIGCKILITTHDRSIMDAIVDSQINYVKVNEGFEEKETLELFSKCLNIDSMLLPSNASKLHKICKGFPLTISLLGAQLEMHKEDTLSNSDRWNFYLEAMSEELSEPFEYTSRFHTRFKSLEKAIEMCIKSLPDDLQIKYQDFALFVNDLNIKPEVLCVLWNLRKTQVEDIMLELMHKSLVVRIWNQPLNSYVYSVHDLLLSNLKKMKSNQELKGLHRKLIESYRTYCRGNFTELPKNDNYIFLYFGYHLKNADLLEEFPLWFLNLKFLESKICTSGPADLLADFTKYRKYIIVKSFYEKYVEEIEEFIKCIGPNLYRTKGDIVQLGLLEPETSFIYKEAHNIAKSCRNPYFYYNIRASENCLPKPHISIIKDKIETAIFGNKYDEVLIATESGSIKVWNIMSHRCLYTYYGHTKRVTHLIKNKLKDQFLSTSDDATIRIWKMKSFPEFNEDSETRTPSPETKQDHWQNAFCKNHERPTDITDCIFILDSHTGPVIFAQFSSDGKLVVSTSTDKKIKIWKLNVFDEDGNLKSPKSITHTSVITKCYFMENKPDDNLLYLTHSQNGSAIHGGKYPFEHFTVLFYLNEKVLSFFPLPSTDEGNEKVLVMTANKVQCHQFSWTGLKRIDEYSQPISKQHYKFFSISEDYKGKQINNFRYLAFSLSNSTIQICNSLTGYNYLELNDPVHDILNLDWFLSEEDLSNWLLCASNDKSIRVWCLKDMIQYTCTNNSVTKRHSNNVSENIICKNEIVCLQSYKIFSEKQNLYCYKLKQNFDAVWLDDSSLLIAAITQCGMLKVLFEGMDQWSIIDKKVSAVSVVHSDQKLDKTMIIVACTDLSIYALKFKIAQHLFNSYEIVDRIFTFYDGDVLVIAALLKCYYRKNDTDLFQIFEIWTNKGVMRSIEVKQFLDCYVYRDKVIVLQKKDEIRILDINYPAYIETKYVAEYSLINASLMLDCSTLALTHSGKRLIIYNVINGINKIDEYALSFEKNELISINVSNNKQFVAIGGQQKIIVFVDIISKTIRQFVTDPSVNIIQSIVWSSDDTRFVVKEVNQIILFDAKLFRKIASVRLTAEKFLVDSILKKFIGINPAGKLVMFNLSEQ